VRVFDCFTFFNELDLLELRLGELDPVVDFFVLAEATRTHSNRPKPLYFAENRGRFERFGRKLIHVAVDTMPDVPYRWVLENYQRNALARGWRTCRPDDLVLVSDLDEIPSPGAVERLKDRAGDGVFYAFEQALYYYYLNGRVGKWLGTVAATVRTAVTHSRATPQGMRAVRTAKRMKRRKVVRDGGWHFSYLGGAEAVKAKIESFAHSELDDPCHKDLDGLRRAIEDGMDIYDRGKGTSVRYVRVDETFPAYPLRNLERFGHLIRDV
jgi:beta-1,4-mannosyl-glycoprotein beta-1,4-N-acetylglucosaminyltransferase